MKAVILAAGESKRLGKLDVPTKCLLEVGGRPLIDHNLERACEVTDGEIIIVINGGGYAIAAHCGETYKGRQIRYILQPTRDGIVGALGCCKKPLEGEDFFMMLGDEVIVGSRHREMLKKFQRESLFGLVGYILEYDRARISRTYSLVLDRGIYIQRLEEKPQKPPNNLMGTGHCIFKNEILELVPQVPVSARSERELVDLVQTAVNLGHPIKAFKIGTGYYNINNPEDLEEARECYAAKD